MYQINGRDTVDDVADNIQLGVLFVLPDYRRSGLAAEITAKVYSKALEMGLEGLYSRTV